MDYTYASTSRPIAAVALGAACLFCVSAVSALQAPASAAASAAFVTNPSVARAGPALRPRNPQYMTAPSSVSRTFTSEATTDLNPPTASDLHQPYAANPLLVPTATSTGPSTDSTTAAPTSSWMPWVRQFGTCAAALAALWAVNGAKGKEGESKTETKTQPKARQEGFWYKKAKREVPGGKWAMASAGVAGALPSQGGDRQASTLEKGMDVIDQVAWTIATPFRVLVSGARTKYGVLDSPEDLKAFANIDEAEETIVPRFRFWQLAALFLLTAMTVGWIVKSGMFWIVMNYTSLPASVVLDHDAKHAVGHALHNAENMLHYKQVMGYAAMYSPVEVTEWLHNLGLSLEMNHKLTTLHAVANTAGDLLISAVVAISVFFHWDEVKEMWKEVVIAWQRLKTATRALTILFVTDFLCGFHSDHMYYVVMGMVGQHYGIKGLEHGCDLLHLFVSTVPVALDTCFKFWIFSEMRSKTKIVLSEIDG